MAQASDNSAEVAVDIPAEVWLEETVVPGDMTSQSMVEESVAPAVAAVHRCS